MTQEGTSQTIQVPPNFFGPASDAVDTVLAFEGVPLSVSDVRDVCECPDDAVDVELEWLDRHGNPTDPDSGHAVEQAAVESTEIDTCVYRSLEVDWDGEGVDITAQIQLRKLSMKSVQPLEITHHETTDPIPTRTRLFDVYITESEVQPDGEMTFTPADLSYSLAQGEINLLEWPIRWDVRFEEIGGDGLVKELTDQPLMFEGTPGSFIRRRS